METIISRVNNKIQTKNLHKMKAIFSIVMVHVYIRVSLVLFFGLEMNWVDSFMFTIPLKSCAVRTVRSSFVGRALLSLNDNVEEDDKDDDEEFDIMSSASPEKSRMTDFIADFLKKTGQENSEAFWGEDGQESIVDNPDTCTHLIAMPVDSCHELMLELESVQRGILYHCPVLVHACIQQAITRLPLLYVRTSGPSATSKLFSIVEDVMEEHLLQPVEDSEEVDDRAILNEDGTRPFTLQFTSLEIDGPKNEILQAVASAEDSYKLRTIVEDLQHRIHKETNWQTMFPPDPQTEAFRARIPFMRLPDNYWEDLLEKSKDAQDEGFVFLPSEEGGNGISPIFWGKWADDDFGTARMREIAVFKRTGQTTGLNEKAFYLPEKYLTLPEGNSAMSKQEAYYRDYQEQRILEAEGIQENESTGRTEDPTLSDDDMLLQMTKERLEELYTQEAEGADNLAAVDRSERDDFESGGIIKGELVDKPIDPAALNDWTRGRIQNIVSSRAKVQSEKELSKPKNKPPAEDNEIFKKFKDGSLAPKQEASPPVPNLPPFPSRQHCVGFWKVLESPTGFDVEETDGSRTDNLVLRVDGTTAGGPILDKATRQKAAGGTWRLAGNDLRIRLIIPPGKERILVMQGNVELVSTKTNIQLASNTFGIPELEARQARSTAEMEDVIHCRGEVWVEDAITKKNRSDVGSFSLMKLSTPSDPKEFSITVPQPTRNQD